MPPQSDESYNCDHWGEVDFGEGPVKVRCTNVGGHDKHVCFVMIIPKPE
jgi:hypothetical protein